MKEKICYAILIFIIFLTSGTTDLGNDKNVIVGGWLLCTVAYFYLENLIKPSFMIMTGIFVILSGIYFVRNGAYNEVTYLGFFIKIYIAYYCRELCKENFGIYYVNLIFVLACISLPLYLLQLANFDFTYRITNFFGADEGHEVKHSILFFTTVPIHDTRNCGFMWEPGAFAAVCAVTMYINIFGNEEKLTSWRNVIFILAILTTKSTMGYLSLLIPISLLMQEAIAENETLKRLAVVIVPAMVMCFYILFSNVDFLSKKMKSEIDGVEEELAFVEKGSQDNFVVATTRTTSVLLDMKTIVQYPLLGLGIDKNTTGDSKQAISTSLTVTACGITSLLLRFGIFGLIFYVFMLYRKAFFESAIHRAGWVFLLFFILFSNELTESAFFHLFIF
jgi:hypothetical protein